MFKKAISLVIVLTLCICLTPVKAIIPGEDAYQPGLGITSTGILFSDIPETLSPAQIEEAGHIARLREEETGKNTAVFQNEDGTNTMYFFAQDIWYENAQGQKMDYSTEIELQPNGTYIGQSNTKTIVLPNRISQGITYSENGYTIEMVPSMDTVISNPIVYETEEAEPPEPTEEPVDEPAETEEPTEEPVEVPTETEEPTEEPVEVPTEEPTEEPVDEPTETEEPVAEPTEVEEPELVEETYERPYSLMNTNTVAEYNPNMVQNIVNGLVLNKPAQLQRNIYEESGREKSTVLYENIYFSNIDIETVPLLHGVRQQIDITDTTRTSFSFKIELNGLVPQNSTGNSIALVNGLGEVEGHINADFSDIYCPYVLDIAGCNDGSYLITVTIDEEYLENKKITVGLDEQIQINAIIGDYYIYDTYVNSGSSNSNYNSSAKLYSGYYGGGTCRTYVRFLLGSAFNGVSPDLITDESFYMYVVNGTYAASIKPNIPNLIWNNSTITWNTSVSVNPPYTTSRNGVTAPSDTTLPNSTGFKSINLKPSGMGTGLIAAFIRDNIDPSLNATLDQSRGIVLVNLTDNNNSTYTKTFYSANNGSNLPYVSISYYTAVSSVSLNITSKTLDVGQTQTLYATVNPSTATNKGVSWTSSKSSVATVSSSGVVTAKSPGTAVITVKTNEGNKTATCTITVNPIPVSSVSLNVTSATLDIDDELQLTATVYPSNATVTSLIWTSSNTSVAQVSASGVVTGINIGNATITATTVDGNKTATCFVKVYPALTDTTTMSFGTNYPGDISSGGTKWYKFTPTTSKYYEFVSTGNTDVTASLYQDTLILATDYDSGEDSNFLICKQLTSGTTYYLKVSSATGGEYEVRVQDLGAALPYIETTGNTQNCLGYAISLPYFIKTPINCKGENMNERSIGTDIDYGLSNMEYFPVVKAYIDEINGYTAILMDSKTDNINSYSYRIAMRIYSLGVNNPSDPTSIVNDYHFWRQTNTGVWAMKDGEGPTELLTGKDPDDTSNWDYATDGWLNETVYYQGPTIYFALEIS